MALAVRLIGYLLAAFMATMAIQKFIGDVPIFQIIEINTAARVGIDLPWIEPWFRYLTGVLEAAAALLLLLGRRREGGGLALAILLGAIAAHLTVLGISTPMSSAPDAPYSPMLFNTALVAFAVALFVTIMSGGWGGSSAPVPESNAS